jgi:hypothetical protein
MILKHINANTDSNERFIVKDPSINDVTIKILGY